MSAVPLDRRHSTPLYILQGDVVSEYTKIDKVETDQTTIDNYLFRIEELKKEADELKERLKDTVKMKLQYQQYIPSPPVPKEALWAQACQNDNVTTNSFAQMWLDHTKENCEKNDVVCNSVMSEHGKNAGRPCIVAGSGPSLKKNADELLRLPEWMPIVSCLHNYGFFEDKGIKVDYYVNLDAGPITIEEVSQGGRKSAKYYWGSTKDKTLVAGLVSNPELIEKWQGKILWYNTLAPSPDFIEKIRAITPLNVFYNVGGNTLGACVYHARAILGSMPIAMVGADFSFDYMQKFHPFDSPYDKQYMGLVPATDIYGNRVYTWQSYYNFKAWFDHLSMGGKAQHPMHMINCTEGGILGAYADGNIQSIEQMELKVFIDMYRHHEVLAQMIKENERPTYLF